MDLSVTWKENPHLKPLILKAIVNLGWALTRGAHHLESEIVLKKAIYYLDVECRSMDSTTLQLTAKKIAMCDDVNIGEDDLTDYGHMYHAALGTLGSVYRATGNRSPFLLPSISESLAIR